MKHVAQSAEFHMRTLFSYEELHATFSDIEFFFQQMCMHETQKQKFSSASDWPWEPNGLGLPLQKQKYGPLQDTPACPFKLMSQCWPALFFVIYLKIQSLSFKKQG